MGFNLRDQYSGYLKKEDFPEPALLTIIEISIVQFETESKVALSFAELPKQMIVNKSNGEILCELFGTDTDQMLDKQIVVYSDPNVMYAGRRVGGLRLRAPKVLAKSQPKPTADEQAAQHAMRTAADTPDDDCPF